MDEQISFLHTVVRRLEVVGIQYMLTGSLALAIWARPRMTRDVDLVIAADESQVTALVGAFARDSYASLDAAREAVATGSMFNVIHFESLFKADFILLQPTRYEQAKFARRREVDLGDGLVVSVISPEDLILSKLQWAKAMASSRQEDDIQVLLRDVKGLDRSYLREWGTALDVEDQLNKLDV